MKKLYVLVFLLFSQTIFAQQRFSKLLKDTPGVVSFTFRNDFSKNVAGTLDYIKEMGIRNIEFSNLFGKTAVEMRALLDARGMVCTSYGVYYDALTNKTDIVIEDAKTLGAEFKQAKLDLKNIVVAGHSFGGITALGAACADQRVKAAWTCEKYVR